MPVAVVATAFQKGDTSTLTCNKPTGTLDGHMMVAFQGLDYSTYASMTAPAGWALLTGNDQGDSLMHMKIWTKLASSEGASYVFNQGSPGDGVVIITTLSGADTNTANWIYNLVWTANSTSRVAPSIASVADSVLLCSATVDMNNVAATMTPPSGMTERADTQSNLWIVGSVASLANPTNPTGTKTFTVSSSNFYASVGGHQSSIVVPPPAASVASGNFFSMF